MSSETTRLQQEIDSEIEHKKKLDMLYMQKLAAIRADSKEDLAKMEETIRSLVFEYINKYKVYLDIEVFTTVEETKVGDIHGASIKFHLWDNSLAVKK